MKTIGILLFLVCISSILTCQVYKDITSSVEDRIEDLIKQMTLEEKIDYIGGYNSFYIRPISRFGLPMITMSDGPVGVRNYGNTTAYPAGIALAASWNKELAFKVGEALGNDARARGVHILLGPGVNIYRAPMCGRNFEYFGEDPYLAGQMTVGYIKGVQSKRVVATVKHFAANNQEWDRYNVSSDIDERTLQEIYLPAFKAAVIDAHVGAVMNAYNLVNGSHCTENDYLNNEVLKGQWNFKGILMSDWVSTHNGIKSALYGLDLEMPSGDHMNKSTLISAISAGKITEQVIDDKVRRILRIIFSFGFYDYPQKDNSIPLNNPKSAQVALQEAREGIVLLKNEAGILPLDRTKIKSLAVIGTNANPAVTGGGGSSYTNPFKSVSVLDGIKKIAGNDISINYSSGIQNIDSLARSNSLFYIPDLSQLGLKGQYFSNKTMTGTPTLERIDNTINFKWGPAAPNVALSSDNFSVRWTGKLRITHPGDYYFSISGDDGYRLIIDNKTIADDWGDHATTQRNSIINLSAGVHDIKIEYYENAGDAIIQFGCRSVLESIDNEIKNIAAKSDAVVLCVGYNSSSESEGFDRPFGLSSEQQILIKTVYASNPNVIIVILAGGNIGIADWIDNAKGIMHAWYPGQEGGTAIAEILFGDINPSGKLPVTFEKKWEDNPVYNTYYDPNNDKKVKYSEGIFVGYRGYEKNKIEPLFPFGYGLSYTNFNYRNIIFSSQTLSDSIVVSVEITNKGKYDGFEIVQLYINDIESTIEHPEKELKGFEKVFLKAGETKIISLKIDKAMVQFFDPDLHKWRAESGSFKVLLGSSSKDIKQEANFDYVHNTVYVADNKLVKSNNKIWGNKKNIYIDLITDYTAHIEVFNLTGQKIMQKQIHKGLNKILINKNNALIIRLISQTETCTHKIIFE